jgi:hypothetical protein
VSAWLAYVLVVLALVCVALNVAAFALAPIVRAERATRTRDETTVERVERTGNVRVLGRDDWGFGEWAS